MPNRIIIDPNKCTLCGDCIKICGGKTLEIFDKTIVQSNPLMCCSCGHCAAMCVQNAIKSGSENKNTFIVNDFDKKQSEIERLLSGKRSVRHFSKKDIEKSVLEKFVYYAEKAPSSSNKRRRKFIIISDENKIIELEKAILQKFNSLKIFVNPFTLALMKVFNKKLSLELSHMLKVVNQMNVEFEKKDYAVFRSAPYVICIVAPTRAEQAKDDCIIAQQYMMLYAESIGIGSCIIGYAQYAHKTVEKVLKVEKGYTVYAVAIFGHPKYEYKKEIQYNKQDKITWI